MVSSDRDPSALAARAAAARAESERLGFEADRLSAEFRRSMGAALSTRTARADAGRGTETDRARIGRLAAAVGRDPSIEEAKRVLQDRHGITGGQAFELLRYLSQHQNRKLREIAQEVVGAR